MTVSSLNRDVCILGLGLIGGSLLKDLQASGHSVFGYNRSAAAVTAATSEGYAADTDLAAVLTAAAKRDALIVIATPMPAVAAMLDAIATYAPTCSFTDVVSVQQAVCDLVVERGLQDRYVGSHPMAGTAHSGWEAAQEGLFHDAAWVIGFDAAAAAFASNEPVPPQWITTFVDVVALAHTVGARVIPATAARHDAAVARISHLPHVLAEALSVVGDQGGALSLSLAAGSYRDGTRVAGTQPALVRAMCETNHAALLDALDETITLLSEARHTLAAQPPSVEILAEAGYRARTRFAARSLADGKTRPVIRLQPGADDWIHQLMHAEHTGAVIDIFAPRPENSGTHPNEQPDTLR
ncbi:prephenate dehydrogenase [Corynebacterium choanae]|uniref:prephenate dehydrogenase n=1 Tax=Corynebacterium choanae TaxID=1862358 RepID=UPI000F4D613A|nr:prephenate dehydrogenase [Corynebacterium choanae]